MIAIICNGASHESILAIITRISKSRENRLYEKRRSGYRFVTETSAACFEIKEVGAVPEKT
jgi:hypothetical protein